MGTVPFVGRMSRRVRVVEWLVASAVALALTVAAACGAGGVSIKDIKAAPQNYDGKTVVLAGTVTSAVNLMFVKFYEVSDGTGTITVVTKRAVPEKGASVRVQGKINQAFALQGKSLLVLVDDTE